MLPKSTGGRNKYSYAVAILNRRTDGTPTQVMLPLSELGLDAPSGYYVRDLFDRKDLGFLQPDGAIQVDVNPSGTHLTTIFLFLFFAFLR